MSDRKTFEYGGYHFTPIRKFHKKEGDFFAISKRLASDPNLGMCTYQERQKVPYDYKGFYAISTLSLIHILLFGKEAADENKTD